MIKFPEPDLTRYVCSNIFVCQIVVPESLHCRALKSHNNTQSYVNTSDSDYNL